MSNEAMEVEWKSEPLDVTVMRNGTKLPKRKVKVREIVGDAWLEREAGLPEGGVKRLVAAIQKLARHGYEARLAESIRFVHMYDEKQGLYLSPQLMGEFKTEVLKGVDFRLMFDGREIESLGDARREVEKRGGGEEGCEDGFEVACITPDPIVVCNVCGNHIRVGKPQG